MFIKISCDSVIECVRASSLNFSCQETPYSFYITLRKSFRKGSHGHQLPSFPPQQAPQAEHHAQAINLKHAYDSIKYDLEDALLENESKDEVITSLKMKLEKLDENALRDCEKIRALTKEVEDKTLIENELLKEVDESKCVIACLEHFLDTCDEKAADDFEKIEALGKDLECALLAKEVVEDKLYDRKKKTEKESTVVHSEKESEHSLKFLDDEDKDLNKKYLNSNLVLMDTQTADFKLTSEEFLQVDAPNHDPPLSPIRASTLPSSDPGTPTPLDFDQISRSFRNFLEDFRDEMKQPKYINQVKETIAYSRKVIHVSMLDLHHHSSFLCEQIRTNYYRLLFSLTCELHTFVAEHVDASRRTEFQLSIPDL